MASKSKGDSKKKALPAAAIKMAKRMGVDLDGFELEAEELWKKLDHMAANTPVEYQAFLDQQYAIQLEEEAKAKLSSASPSSTVPTSSTSTLAQDTGKKKATPGSADRYFRPENGFSIKVKTTGNDGLKIRGVGEGKTLYINFCHHVALDIPMDAFGTQVINFSSANGLSIPLVVGPLRDLEKATVDDPLSVTRDIGENDNVSIRPHSLAVDVIFHRSVIDACEKRAGFKSQIVNLAFEWVTQDTGVQFSYTWVDVKEKYVGGLGDDGDTPVLFFVNLDDHDASMAALQAKENARTAVSTSTSQSTKVRSGINPGSFQATTDSSRSADLLSNPASLLKGIINDQSESVIEHLATSSKPSAKQESTTSPIMPTLASRATSKDTAEPVDSSRIESTVDSKKKKSVLIQDLSAPVEPEKAKPTGKKDTAIKKGFLTGANSGKLYPTGSTEGAGGAKGGSFARVMDKCQVVNMGTGEVKMPASATGSSTTKKVSFDSTSSNSTPAQSQTTPAAPPTEPIESKLPPKALPTSYEIEEANRLLESMDEEFGRKAVGAMTEDSISSAFGDLAKILLGPTPGVNTHPGQGMQSVNQLVQFDSNASASNPPPVQGAIIKTTRNSLPSKYAVLTQLDQAIVSDRRATIQIQGLTADKFKVSSVDVNATSTEIVIEIPPTAPDNDCFGSVQATIGNCRLDPKSVTANYSKKKGVLTVTASVLG